MINIMVLCMFVSRVNPSEIEKMNGMKIFACGTKNQIFGSVMEILPKMIGIPQKILGTGLVLSYIRKHLT